MLHSLGLEQRGDRAVEWTQDLGLDAKAFKACGQLNEGTRRPIQAWIVVQKKYPHNILDVPSVRTSELYTSLNLCN